MFLAVRRAGDCKDGNDREPNVTDKLGSIARRLRGGTALELYARCVRDLVKANVHGPRLETGLTISKVVYCSRISCTDALWRSRCKGPAHWPGFFFEVFNSIHMNKAHHNQ
jgi:hypothetical protein